MSWNEILVGIAGIIVAFGGAGGIIVAVSKWLGNMMAESLQKKLQAKYEKELEQVKQSHQKEIEAYKNELRIACENIKRGNAEAIYVTEKQFDIEIELFQELTEKAFVLEFNTKALFADLSYFSLNEVQQREISKELYSKFLNSFNDFVNILGKSRAFINMEIYDSYIIFSDLCKELGGIFMIKIMNGWTIDKNELRDCKEKTEKMRLGNAATSLLIKAYLAKLKITKQNIEIISHN